VEAVGGGTIAYDTTQDRTLHVSVGLKDHSATAHTIHPLSAKIQFLTVMMVIEVAGPSMGPDPDPTPQRISLLVLSRFPGIPFPGIARVDCAAADPA
jgi:hypothetical protein